MKRIMIIGCCGAGKSTLAKQVQQKTGLPLIHLDKAYWRPNWEETPKEEWEDKVRAMVQQERWIIDGNYGGSMDIRLASADTIIFLDRSRWLCLYRVLKRILLYYKRSRPDMAAGCVERFDWNFLMYVFHFYENKRPQILQRLDHYRSQKNVYTFRNDRSIRQFLAQLS